MRTGQRRAAAAAGSREGLGLGGSSSWARPAYCVHLPRHRIERSIDDPPVLWPPRPPPSSPRPPARAVVPPPPPRPVRRSQAGQVSVNRPHGPGSGEALGVADGSDGRIECSGYGILKERAQNHGEGLPHGPLALLIITLRRHRRPLAAASPIAHSTRRPPPVSQNTRPASSLSGLVCNPSPSDSP